MSERHSACLHCELGEVVVRWHGEGRTCARHAVHHVKTLLAELIAATASEIDRDSLIADVITGLSGLVDERRRMMGQQAVPRTVGHA